MKLAVTRFKCDAPDCEDVVDVEGLPQTPTTAVAINAPMPEGWIEFSVTGATPGGQPALVHASTPECAEKLAAHQVERAVEVAEQVRREEEERAERAERDRVETEREQQRQEKAEAKRAAEAAEAERVAAEENGSEDAEDSSTQN